MCLNTVAVLFVLELDNAMYSNGINDKTRGYLEENSHIQLTQEDMNFLSFVKNINFASVCGIVLFILMYADQNEDTAILSPSYSQMGFGLAGLCEVLYRPAVKRHFGIALCEIPRYVCCTFVPTLVVIYMLIERAFATSSS